MELVHAKDASIEELEGIFSRLKGVLTNLNQAELADVEECLCRKIVNKNFDNESACRFCQRPFTYSEDKINSSKENENPTNLAERVDASLIENLKETINNLQEDLKNKDCLIKEKDTHICSLGNDLTILNQKYVEEINKLSEVQHAKAEVEHELEDLSRNLFENANEMVYDARKAAETFKCDAEAAKAAKEKLEDEVLLLRNQLFIQANLNKENLKKIKDKNELNSDALLQIPGSESSNFNSDEDEIDEEDLDEEQLNRFEIFAAGCVGNSLQKVFSLPYFKACLEEDIEPCLNFGPSARIYPKRVLDAIYHGSLTLASDDSRSSLSLKEDVSFTVADGNSSLAASGTSSPSSKAMNGMWSKWSMMSQALTAGLNSSVIPANGCHACGREIDCPYRLALIPNQFMPIDKFCRDKIVATIDFFKFVQCLSDGTYNQKRIDALYTETLRLRLRMFYARLGFLPSKRIDLPTHLEFPSTNLMPRLEDVDFKLAIQGNSNRNSMDF